MCIIQYVESPIFLCIDIFYTMYLTFLMLVYDIRTCEYFVKQLCSTGDDSAAIDARLAG